MVGRRGIVGGGGRGRSGGHGGSRFGGRRAGGGGGRMQGLRSAAAGLLDRLVHCCLRSPPPRRSGRVSIEREQNAVLIRVTGPEEGYSEPLRGSSDGTSSSLGSTTGLGSGGPSQAVPSDGDRLPLETLDIRESRPLHTGRFLTMNHKRRRRRLTTRTLSSDAALLDDIHHGQAQIVLDRVGEWPFNAFTLDTVTGGRSVPILCVHLFHWYGLFDHFNLDVVCVWKLFTLVEEGYHSTNPYHNAIHAADVTQAMHCFLQEEKIREHLTPLEIMAALIGAVTHDLDHPGVNQPFLIATSNHLAALYENTSVLENHHWRSAVGCLLESGVAAQLGPHRMELEQNISSLILATDITRQQEFLTRFKRYLDGNLLDMERNTDRHFILQIALKCADISNPCRPWDVSKKWSHKVCEEFFRQGDYERKLNLPVTSLCDRHTTSVPKIQAGFFRFVVAPLFDEWHRFLKTSLSTEMSNNLNTNRARWDSLVQQEQAEETRTEVSDAELPEVDDVADVSAIDDMSPDNDTVPSPPLPLHSEDDLWSRRVGRRHSVPLSAPREPTTALTIIRRESLPGEPHPRRLPSDAILHIEDEEEGDTSHAGNSLSLSSVCSGGNGNERPVSAENLLPEPSIASITSSREASRLCGVLHGASVTTSGGTKYLTRQQTFPPLQPIGFPFSRLRYMSTTVEMSTHDERINEGPSSTDTSSHTSAVSSPEGTKCPGFSRGIVGKDVGTRSWSLGPYREGKREPESEMDPPRERNKLARLEGGCPGETAIDSPRRQPALQAGKENRDPSQPCIPPSALGDGSNQDSEQEWSRSSNHRKSLPQGLPHLQCRRGSAPVGLLKLEEGSVAASKGVMLPPHSPLSPALASAAATVLSAVVISNPDRACRRGSMPVEVSRQSVLRSLGSKENTLPSSCMARRSSLPYDLVRHNSSSLLECLNFSSGLERKKDCLAEVQQKLDPCETDKSLDVDGELVGLNWPAPRCSSAPSEERANRARERRPHSPPDSRSVTCGPVRGGIRQLPPLLLASSALPQPANAPPTARAKRKVLQRRSSGGPELFAMQSDGTEGGVGGGGRVGVRWGVTWQEGLESAPAEGGGLVGEEEKEIEDERLSTSMFQTPRVGDWCRRRGSLPVEALVTSSGV